MFFNISLLGNEFLLAGAMESFPAFYLLLYLCAAHERMAAGDISSYAQVNATEPRRTRERWLMRGDVLPVRPAACGDLSLRGIKPL